jgi:DNA gyrase/topoisomerase IV subunit A
VGLATNIPPHNLNEVIDGTLAYIDNTEISTKGLMEHIKGPDLPTGGILIGKNSLISAYETGEGKVTFRARTNIEKLEYGRLVNAAGMTGEKQRKLAEEFPSPYHWKFRVVPNKGEPPAWCPLRKFEVKG